MQLFLTIFPAVVQAFKFVPPIAFDISSLLNYFQTTGHRAAAGRRLSVRRPVNSPLFPIFFLTCIGDLFCRLGGCNMSSLCFTRIVQSVSSLHLPLLILGGGGYNEIATAKTWIASTAAACGAELPTTVPLHDFYADYGPTFCFKHVRALFRSKSLALSRGIIALNAFSGQQQLTAR